MNAKKIGCREVVDLLVDYLDGELGAETVKGLEEHLSGCDSCTAFLNTYRKTIALSQKLKYGDIPPELRKRLRDFLREKIRKEVS
jgi:anti-sigma factor (TIGR02949 family)